MVDHTVQRVIPSTLIGHESKVGLVLGDSVNRHAVHARKEVFTERIRKTILGVFSGKLISEKLEFVQIFRSRPIFVMRSRVTWLKSIGPRPETFAQARAHRFDKFRIRMIGEICFKGVDVDR